MAKQAKMLDKAAMLANVKRAYREGKLSQEAVERLEAAGYDLLKNNLVAGVSDLATTRSELAAEWHPTKNGDLKPSEVKAGSHKKVWWRCEKGHEWQALVSDRSQGSGCPFCGNSKVLAGYNDLATTHPDLAAQWHPSKNGALEPCDVLPGSSKKVWWRCEKGHEWQASVASRTRQEAGCPYCANQRVLDGFNDLASKFPGIASEWNEDKNGILKPTGVAPGSSKKVWWRCEKGHEWQATVASRTLGGSGCPYCIGRRPIAGVNDLATSHPDLAAQWHPTKNGTLQPADMKPGSTRKVWWRCEKGHEWQASVASRAARGYGCPYCLGREAISGETDLATTHPELAAEWHPTKNGDLKPSEVKAGSSKKVWWRCEKGHEWQAVIAGRALRGYRCPYCGNKRLLPGYNDLATKRPDLAVQWHPTKNGALEPCDVQPGSSKKVWWRCEKGHEWRAAVKIRARGDGCPSCRKRENAGRQNAGAE